MTVAPMPTGRSSSSRPTSGGWFTGSGSTVTSKVCTAGRPGPALPSVTPTVIVETPAATPATTKASSAMPDTVATSTRLVSGATYSSSSPSGSVNVPPSATRWAWSMPMEIGGSARAGSGAG